MNHEVPAAELRGVSYEDTARFKAVSHNAMLMSGYQQTEALTMILREVLELRTLVEGIAACTGYMRPEGVRRIHEAEGVRP